MIKPSIVINTGPILSIIAATNSLDILSKLFAEIYVPKEVVDEVTVNNSTRFGADEFNRSDELVTMALKITREQ
jgi:predicted nucleic acid-binding protein